MYYLVGKHANVDRRIVTENHPVVQMHLREADRNWDAEKIIKWMWGIEKKSENVFELIEEGDLVECANSYFTCVKEKSKTYDKHLIFMNNFSTIYDKHILAIYKPNSKGDYIKVWGRES